MFLYYSYSYWSGNVELNFNLMGLIFHPNENHPNELILEMGDIFPNRESGPGKCARIHHSFLDAHPALLFGVPTHD